jgi:hypothetical protein
MVMRVKLVTGYVPIAGHPRGPKEYGELGEKLGGVPVRKKAFYDQMRNLWMTKVVRDLPFVPSPSVGDNPDKNSTAYHIVNHQKTTWLVDAANDDPEADFLVWCDYGIFSQPGISNQIIYEMFDKLARSPDDAIYIPGCWDKPTVIESVVPCWRFCGSIFAVPRKLVDALDYSCRVEARQHIRRTHNIEWEINTLARVEARGKLPFRWYRADHNETLFTNFPEPTGGQPSIGEP